MDDKNSIHSFSRIGVLMEKIVFVKVDGFYKAIYQTSYDASFLNLVIFLEDDFPTFTRQFMESLYDDEHDGMGGNIIYMEKTRTDSGCTLVSLGSDLEDRPDPNELVLIRDEFVETLKEWMKLCGDPNINEITLVYDEDTLGDLEVALTGRFVENIDENLKDVPGVIKWK